MNIEMNEYATGTRPCRDRRIERVVELVPPVQMLEELPLGRGAGGRGPRAPSRGQGDPGPRATIACWSSSGRAASTTPTRRSSTPRRLAAPAAELSDELWS